ncbi:MAG TPA: hypothetical protein VFW20_08825 [Candidatus Limnocylindrales bacterium]|nr:hypothetical protein [Candidatus Limnocylindrales bacterium]
MPSIARRLTATPAIVALGLVLVACSTPPPSPGPSGPSSPSAPSSPSPASTPGASPSPAAGAALLLRVTTEGGFIAPAATLAAIPEVSVYADGRIMTPAPSDLSLPGPLLPTVAVRDVGADGARAIVAAIRAAGLDAASDGGSDGIPGDTGTTVFAVNVDGHVVTTRLVLGGGTPGLPGGLASPGPAAQAATALLDRLEDTSETWGANSVRSSTFQPNAYRVFAAPGAPNGQDASSAPTVAWPLATPLASFGAPAVPDRGIAGLRQGAVFGGDAAALGPILAAANSQTAFISGGMLYTLFVRPLLPDEVPAQG